MWNNHCNIHLMDVFSITRANERASERASWLADWSIRCENRKRLLKHADRFACSCARSSNVLDMQTVQYTMIDSRTRWCFGISIDTHSMHPRSWFEWTTHEHWIVHGTKDLDGSRSGYHRLTNHHEGRVVAGHVFDRTMNWTKILHLNPTERSICPSIYLGDWRVNSKLYRWLSTLLVSGLE